MEKRVLIAVVLSFLVLYAYQSLFMPKPVAKPPARTAQSQAATGTGAISAAAAGSQTATAQPAGAATATAPSTVASPAGVQAPVGAKVDVLIGDTDARDVLVDTETIRATFTNQGATLKNWSLKRYTDKAGKPLDLVPQDVPRNVRPFSIDTGNASVDDRLNSALFRVEGDGPSTDPKTGVALVAFEYREASGLRARKTFAINPKNYTIEASLGTTSGVEVANLALKMGYGLGDVGAAATSQYSKKPAGILFRAGSIERHDAKAIVTQPTYEGDVRWGGVDDHYFMSAALFAVPGARLVYDTTSVPNADGKTTRDYVSYTVKPPAGSNATIRFFIGPKQFDLLQGIDQELVRAVDFGWFAFISVPLLRMLNGINDYLHNYGWSIIALTLFINLVIFPLRHKSVVSMRKMQGLQPEIKAIQDRYGKLKATDPEKQKMNTELMELYKQRGVNPASGCLPMLLTMPVLFAFYNLLSQAIELRGAPFAFWIKDLSLQDPLYVTPVLMGITMVVQQKMTPSTADPVQQKMFMFMPIVFTGMFLWAPSGLVIYWFFSNLLAILQQVITNRIIGPQVVHVVRPAAERKLKRVGGGKTNGVS
ncbi:MAG: membrane protein insertase YidC [Acidobacteria bacterium]|nr:membrane protein insertase YidC [Acidobacteriota bacterium]